MGLVLFIFAIMASESKNAETTQWLLWAAWFIYLIFHDCQRRPT